MCDEPYKLSDFDPEFMNTALRSNWSRDCVSLREKDQNSGLIVRHVQGNPQKKLEN